MQEEKQRIFVIDCDPGADDALGILLALGGGIRPVGILSCYGNGPAGLTAENAARICALAGERVPVYQGAGQPLKRSFEPVLLYSGADGLCESGLLDAKGLIRSISAEEFLRQLCRNGTYDVTYLVTGALTNLASGLLHISDLRCRIREIVTVSGNFGMNRRANRSEWNIEIDPHAAQIVYASGIPIRAVGLDVTIDLQDAYTEELISALPEGKIRTFLAACTAYNIQKGLNVSSLLNDGMAAALLLRPELAEYRRGIVRVNPDGVGTDMTAFTENSAGNVQVAEAYDFHGYLSLLKDTLRKMG